jgi:hypothetical protein
MTIMRQVNTALLCEALFVSDLEPSPWPEPAHVRAAIRRAILAYGLQDCAVRVAREFADHPDVAAARMVWARDAVSRAYFDRGRGARRVRPYSYRHGPA